jgi:hypothetical protein
MSAPEAPAPRMTSALLARRFLADYVRNPVNLLMLVLVPAVFTGVAAGSIADAARLLGGPGGARMQETTAAWSAAFVAALAAYFQMRAARDADRRLVLAGLPPWRLAAARAATGLALAVLASAAAVVTLAPRAGLAGPGRAAMSGIRPGSGGLAAPDSSGLEPPPAVDVAMPVAAGAVEAGAVEAGDVAVPVIQHHRPVVVVAGGPGGGDLRAVRADQPRPCRAVGEPKEQAAAEPAAPMAAAASPASTGRTATAMAGRRRPADRLPRPRATGRLAWRGHGQ